MTTTIDHAPEIDEPPTTEIADRSGPAAGERPETEAAPTWEALRALEERLERRATLRDGWTIVMFVCSAIAILGSIIAIGFGSRAIDESKRNVRSPAASATTSGAAPATTGPAVPAANVLTPAAPVPVALNDFRVGLSSTNLAVGKYTFQISNTGQVPHELLVFQTDISPSRLPTASDGAIQEDAPGVNKASDGDNLDPGASQTRAVDLSKPGTYVFVCNLPGHFKAGMYSVVTVK